MNIDPSILKERLSTKYKVSESTFLKAQQKVESMPEHINNSIRDREGFLPGFIGEFLVNYIKKGKVINTFDYDLIIPEGLKIDVKTKERSVAPRPNYLCSVASFNIDQKCDEYSFVSISRDYKYAWYLGSIEKEEFFHRAKEYKEGEKDPDSPPHKPFYFTCDCYNLEIYKLTH